jgi:hypothetical protein
MTTRYIERPPSTSIGSASDTSSGISDVAFGSFSLATGTAGDSGAFGGPDVDAIEGVVATTTTLCIAGSFGLDHVASPSSIIKRGNGKCLEIADSSTSIGARAQQWECNDQPGMYWYIRSEGNGTHHIVSRSSGLSLEIENSSYDNGARARQMVYYNSRPGENWTFPDGPPFSGSTYIINGSGKCLEIENSSFDNGAPAQQWDCVGQTGAQWHIQRAPFPYNP